MKLYGRYAMYDIDR